MKTVTFVILIFAAAIVSCSTKDVTGNTEITRWQDGKTGAISITYDDATINQFRQALPIMDTLGFKGTFFINTADIPDSKFPPLYIGRPISRIIQESSSIATTKENLFERASTLRFLNIEGAIESHNNAGALYENNKLAEACRVVDEAFAVARKEKAFDQKRPVLLTGEVITWKEIKSFAARGHEFGSHTISHPRLAVLDEANLLYELEKCKEEIQFQLGPEHTFSAECPFGTEDERVMEYAYKVHPALRNRMPEPFLEELNRSSTTTPGISRKEYVQWQRGPLSKTPMDLMKSWVDTLMIHNNIWLVLTFHGVDGVGWEAKSHDELGEYFRYMKEREAQLWVATFKDVTKYIRERMNSKVTLSSKSEKIVLNLTHSLDKDLYVLPLTLKTYVPSDWKDVTVKQGDTEEKLKIATDEKGPYVLYRATPNAGEISLFAR